MNKFKFPLFWLAALFISPWINRLLIENLSKANPLLNLESATYWIYGIQAIGLFVGVMYLGLEN